MKRRSNIAFVFLILLALGCASAPKGSAGAVAAHHDPNYIALSELQTPELQSLNTYDAVSRLRPNFLRVRGQSSIANESAYQVKVRVDGTLMGGLDALKDIPVYEVQDIRYYPPSESVPKFGTEYPAGAIDVRRRHG